MPTRKARQEASVFILFDTRGGRTTEGQHVKSPAAMERAKKRRSKEKAGNIINTSAMVKPTLDEEIKQFKAICRYILHNDLQEEPRKWFRMEPRMQWRRLALLGIEGNQPAISACCETTEEEDEGIAKAILMQKVGANPKTTKAHTEMTKARSEATDDQAGQLVTFYKKARIANGATIRWKRSIAEHVDKEEAEQGGQGEGDDQQNSGPTYTSRLLSCIRCGHPQETSWMQLRVKNGFRAIDCRQCRLQQQCSRNNCQCGKVWRHCPTHRTDPAKHMSKQAPKRTKEEQERWKKHKLKQKPKAAGAEATPKGKEDRRKSKKVPKP